MQSNKNFVGRLSEPRLPLSEAATIRFSDGEKVIGVGFATGADDVVWEFSVVSVDNATDGILVLAIVGVGMGSIEG